MSTDKSSLKGTFFDTFSFNSPKDEEENDNEGVVIEEKEPKEEEKKKPEEKPEDKKIETKSEKEEVEPKKVEPSTEEVDNLATTLKAKKPEELDEEEKGFLDDYEKGLLTQPETKKEDEVDAPGYIYLVKNLSKDGILLGEIEESEDLKDDPEILTKAINQTVEQKVSAYIDEIPEDYRNVIDHLRTGGTVEDYLQAKQRVDYDSLDYTNEGLQRALVKANLQQQGYPEDEIEEKITDLKDLDKLEKEAKRAGAFFDKQQVDRFKQFDAEVQAKIAKQEEDNEKEVEQISTTIDNLSDIAGFKLNTKKKEAFKKYLFDVDANGETAASKASKSIDNRIKLYFMDFIGYNFKDLEKEVTTKKTKDLSKLLNRYTDTNTIKQGKQVSDKDPDSENKPIVFPSIFNRDPFDE